MVMPIPHIRVVLINPLIEGNIGAVARAMKNFDLHDLRLVDPPDIGEEARCRAKHANDILESAKIQSFDEAVAGAALVAGTTGITTSNRRHPLRIAVGAEEFAGRIPDQQGDIALLFGRENDGLHNDEIARCDLLVTIPTDNEYPILNLSHAASVVFYEIFKHRRGGTGGRSLRQRFPAADREYPGRELLFQNFERLLHAIGWPEHRRPNTNIMFRRIMGRAMPKPEEYHTMIGVIDRAADLSGTGKAAREGEKNVGEKMKGNLGKRVGEEVGIMVEENIGKKEGRKDGENIGIKVGKKDTEDDEKNIGINVGRKDTEDDEENIGIKVGKKEGEKYDENIGKKEGKKDGEDR